MAWEPGAPHAGFSTGDPWLAVVVPEAGTAAEQASAAGSPLALYRELIALRRELRGPVEIEASAPELVTLRRGEHVISLNAGDRAAPAPRVRELLLHTHDVQAPPDLLHPGEGLLGRTC
jgi:alpha-glucosidase